MDKFIALVDSALSVEMQINEDLLQSFTRKVTVWDYYVTKGRYLALFREEKEIILRNFILKWLKGHWMVIVLF